MPIHMSTVSYPHIELRPDGTPMVSGTTTKVIEIVQDHLAHHWSADEILRQYPYLTLAKIHAALTYYYDHQQAMGDEIEQRWQKVSEIKSRRDDSTIREKLRQLGHLP
jgi:uncharacterized protein (DUF433 family)